MGETVAILLIVGMVITFVISTCGLIYCIHRTVGLITAVRFEKPEFAAKAKEQPAPQEQKLPVYSMSDEQAAEVEDMMNRGIDPMTIDAVMRGQL